MTATQLIYRALRDIGCLRAGQTTSTDVLNDCLTALNDMIDSWLLDELMVFTVRDDLYTLTGGIQDYTIGPTGANFIAARPTGIRKANVVLNTVNPVVRLPVKIIDHDDFAAIRVRSIPYAIPQVLHYEYDLNQTDGHGTLHLWPGPLAAYQLELLTWQQLQSFADLATDYKFPPGYPLALRKALAVAVVPMMKPYFKIDQPLVDVVASQAQQAIQAIQTFNAPSPKLECDLAFMSTTGGGAFNYMLGTSGRGR